MEISSIKYQFIERIIKIDNPDILIKLNTFLNKLKKQKPKPSQWMQFAGIWNEEEANEISEVIKDCEKINYNEW